MNKKCILVVEDDKPKMRSIISFLEELSAEQFDVLSAESLTSALHMLSISPIDFALVDMSIPTYDLSKDRRGGGQPLGFGGTDILRFIDTECENTKSAIITQYEEFSNPLSDTKHTIKQLEQSLKSELDRRFYGVIHYSGQHGTWRKDLLNILEASNILEKK